jgi:streptogramin lyase
VALTGVSAALFSVDLQKGEIQVKNYARMAPRSALSLSTTLGWVFWAVFALVPIGALAHGNDAAPFGGRMPGQPDFRKVGETTWRFLPGRGEYEVRHPNQPRGFVHLDPLPEHAGVSSAGENAADGIGGLIPLPSNTSAPICRTSGPRIVVVYSHRSSDGTPTPTATIRSIVQRMNWKIGDQSSQSSGGKRVVKMAVDCNESKEINVYNVATINNNFASQTETISGALFGLPTGENAVKYLIFDHSTFEEDPTGIAGIGGPIRDDPLKSHFSDNGSFTASAAIYNATSEGTAVWETHATIHELMHALGASQGRVAPGFPGEYPNAPFSSPGHHCSDGLDILCYQEAGWYYFSDYCSEFEGYKTPTTIPIDCNKDTYFNAAPKSGTWLAENWDLAGPEDWFLVAPPKATTLAAANIKGKSATLSGEINPEGTNASYRIQYGLASKGFYESQTAWIDVGYGKEYSLEGVYKAEVPITNLALGSAYKFRIVAKSADNQEAFGEEKTFTTLSPPTPTVTTEAATSVGSAGATLNGTVNPNGTETTYQFEYGKTTSYGKILPAWPGTEVGAGTTSVKASQAISFNVEPNTTYHYRLKAMNEGGTTTGADKTFKTPRAVNPPTYVSSFGSNGTGNGQFTNPWGIAVDPSGNVWVSDTSANRIQKFNSKGEYQCQIGSKGSGNGQFSSPRGLAADAAGNVWVADSGNGRIEEISPECKYVGQFGSKGSGNGALQYPQGVALDLSGNIWVADSQNVRIQKFNSKGEYQAKCGSWGTGDGQFEEEPLSIAADSDGNIWVGDENARLEQFNSKCEFVSKFSKTSSGDPYSLIPYSIAIDPAGNIWSPSLGTHAVVGFYPEGEYVTKFGESGSGGGQFTNPQGVAIAADGTFWALDHSATTNRVEKWVPGAAPAVLTGTAKTIKRTEATLKGTINPEGTATSYQFEYGTTQDYGSTAPATPKSIGSGSSGVAVSEALSGLKAGTTYYYHVVATSSKGTTYGETRHFTTLPGAGGGAQVRIGGKTFAELGITEASISHTGSFMIEIPGYGNLKLSCSESGTGTLISSGLSSESITLNCSIVGASPESKCKVLPMFFSVNGKFETGSGYIALLFNEYCSLSEEFHLTSPSGSFEYGTEAVSLNVNTNATASFAGPVYFKGNSKWTLTGANAGKTLGFW